MPCTLSRLLLPAAAVGSLVATLTAHDGLGWVAAALTAGAVHLALRARGTPAACPLPDPSSTPALAAEAEAEGTAIVGTRPSGRRTDTPTGIG